MDGRRECLQDLGIALFLGSIAAFFGKSLHSCFLLFV
jgi:hypothetical protein